MGVIIKVRKGNYIFDYLHFMGAPLPTARIIEDGNEIPMTIEEIDAWREDYLQKHSEVDEERGDKHVPLHSNSE